MSAAICFKHVDEEIKEILTENTYQILDRLGEDTDCNVQFSRSADGHFIGTIHAFAHWGEAYAKAESSNAMELYFQLKKRIVSQIKKRSNRKKLNKRRGKKMMEVLLNEKTLQPEEPVVSRNILSFKEQQQLPAANTPALKNRQPEIKTLIIDDDLDSLLPVFRILRELGSQTAFAIDSADATEKIATGSYQLIILDWWMDKNTGGEIVQKSVDQLHELSKMRGQGKLKIITYSGRM